MNGKRFSEEKARRSGFYLALAVCLVAVGVAAWSTYDAVNSTLDTQESQALISQQAQEVREDQQVSEKPAEESSTSSRQETQSANEADTASDGDPDDPESTLAAQETAGEPEQSQSQAQETPAPESSQPVPANAPLYQLSTEMVWPIEGGEVQQAYSAGAPVYSPTMKDWRIHTGVDIQAESESPVVACANGQVKETYTDSMLGNVVLIEHGDTLFYYCGVGENFLVQPGDVVSMGQQIGVVTAVPFEAAQEPHLHLEARRDGVALDPQEVIEGTA